MYSYLRGICQNTLEDPFGPDLGCKGSSHGTREEKMELLNSSHVLALHIIFTHVK